MMLQLLWKESREHWWKMVALLVLVMGPMAGVAFWDVIKDARQRSYGEGFGMVVVLGCWLVPIWIGAWTATGERTHGTLRVLEGLPVRRWKLFAVKSVWGLATLLVPLAVGLAGASWARWAEDVRGIWTALMVATSLYLMIVAATAGVRKEGMAAMVGLLIVLGTGLWAGLAANMDSGRLAWWLMLPNPFFVLWSADVFRTSQPALEIQGAIAVMWWVIGAWRFGKKERRESGGVQLGAISRARAQVGPGRLGAGALLWREWREQKWVVISAGVAAVVLAMLGSVLDVGHVKPGERVEQVMNNFVAMMAVVAVTAPTAAAVILGVGSLAVDLEPRLMGFWRSRPIQVGAFFWSKYVVALSGISLLMVVLIGAAMVGTLVLDTGDHVHDPSDVFVILVAMVGWLPLVLTLTMFLYVLIRRAIYVVILVVAVLGTITFGIDSLHFYLNGPDIGEVIFVGMLAIFGWGSATGLAVLTRVALGRDWKVG